MVELPEVQYVIKCSDGIIRKGYWPTFSSKAAQRFEDIWDGKIVEITVSGDVLFQFHRDNLDKIPEFWKHLLVDKNDWESVIMKKD